jgi:hypothetical protein
MTSGWSINVSGQVYGPYPWEQMRGFVHEGRLSPGSLIAREGSIDWHEAQQYREFAGLFALRSKGDPEIFTFAFGARPTDVPTASANESAPATKAKAGTQFVLFMEMKSGTSQRLEETINSFGPNYRLKDHNIWIISTDQSVNLVRNRLVKECGKNDSVLVIDASRAKAAWFNFGPEADVHISRIWQQAS